MHQVSKILDHENRNEKFGVCDAKFFLYQYQYLEFLSSSSISVAKCLYHLVSRISDVCGITVKSANYLKAS